jgi:hypothetical protein
MRGLSAYALFCEDVRRESDGKYTIIGGLPDTLRLPRFPWTMHRITVHFRIKIDADFVCDKPLTMELESRDAEILEDRREPAPADLIERTIARAKERGLPYGSIMGRMELSEPLEFPAATTLFAVLKYGDEREICGVLNLVERTPAAKEISSVSEPPSKQSPPFAPPS